MAKGCAKLELVWGRAACAHSNKGNVNERDAREENANRERKSGECTYALICAARAALICAALRMCAVLLQSELECAVTWAGSKPCHGKGRRASSPAMKDVGGLQALLTATALHENFGNGPNKTS